MASYLLRFDSRFERQFQRLPGDIRAVVRETLRSLARDPMPPAARELVGHQTYYRLWLPRGHRLVYQVLQDEAVVDLLHVGPKSPDLYGRLGLERPSDD